MQDILQRIGLTDGEARVYEALLDLGQTTSGDIISKSGVSSSKVYDILDRLAEKGLATHIVKDNVKHFSPSPPKKLLTYLEREKQAITDKEQRIKERLPDLQDIYEATSPEYKAVIYEDFEGLRTTLFNALEDMEYWLALGASNTRPGPAKHIWDKFHNERVNQGIPAKMIVIDQASYNHFNKLNHTTCKLIELKAIAPLSITNNTVLLFNWERISTIEISSDAVSDSFQEFFKALWEDSEKKA